MTAITEYHDGFYYSAFMDTGTVYFIVDTHPDKVASMRIPTAFPNLQQAVNALGFLRHYYSHPECLSIEQVKSDSHH